MGRAAHQRHAGPAPRAARRPAAAGGLARPDRAPAAPRRAFRDRTAVRFRPSAHADPHRAADGQRPVVTAAQQARRRSHPAGARARADAARAARRADQGRGGRRADRGRLRRGVPGPARHGGGRPVPPRLLRRRTRRGAVRAARGGGPDAGAGRPRGGRPGSSPQARPFSRTGPRACGGGPGSALRGGAALAGPARRDGLLAPAGPQGRRADRAGGGIAGPVRRAWRPDPAVLDRRSRAAGGHARSRWPPPSATARSAG